MPSRTAKIPMLASAPYADVETAVKELGSLWVLNLINKTLSHTKDQRERLERQRSRKRIEHAEQDENIRTLNAQLRKEK